jgi:hypothetical protein
LLSGGWARAGVVTESAIQKSAAAVATAAVPAGIEMRFDTTSILRLFVFVTRREWESVTASADGLFTG